MRLESPAAGVEIAHLTHRSGVQITLPVIADGGATFGTLHLCGTVGQVTLRLADTYFSRVCGPEKPDKLPSKPAAARKAS